MDINLIMPWLSMAVALIAILRFSDYKRQGAVTEGKKCAEMEQLKRDIASAHDKVRDLEREHRGFDIEIVEMKSDIKHILQSITKIEKMLEDK